MVSIRESCDPRPDLVKGSFNPEVLTASLRQVIGSYRGDIKMKTLYSDAQAFFGEGLLSIVVRFDVFRAKRPRRIGVSRQLIANVA